MSASAKRSVITISAGLGPIEARAFVAHLADELVRRLEASGTPVIAQIATDDGERPRSIDLVVEGDPPAAWLGTHALVSRSATRSRRARKRWFVGVSMRDDRPEREAAALRRSDLEISFCRAGGPGGQHVNRTESAVRVRHVPSGVVVRADARRSRERNLADAMRRIEAVLAARGDEALARTREDRRDRCLAVERGRAVATWRHADAGLVQETERP